MSESDSSIPGTVAALAGALEAVCQYVGSENESPGLFYRSFLGYLNALSPNPDPWNGTPEEERKKVLATAARFLEALDTAERLLNAIPFSGLEPLSSFTDGVRWDVQTRRTIKEIQACISILDYGATKPDFLLTYLRAGGNHMQQELYKFSNLLRKRIFDLQCLPDGPTAPKNAIPSQRRPHQSSATNPNENMQGDGGTVVPALNTESSTETDENLPEMIAESPPPKYDPNSADWILSETLCKVLGIKASTINGYRKPGVCGKDKIDEFGTWNVDCIGKFRRNVNKKKSVAYYRPAMSSAYTAKLEYAESQKRQKT